MAARGIRRSHAAGILSAVLATGLTGGSARAQTGPAETFTPTAALDMPALMQLVARRSVAMQADLLARDLARADAEQARLLGNPVVDGSWNTIPLGETNPPGLSAPLTHIPNYGLGVSYTFPLGKRGPRAARADALFAASREQINASARGMALDLTKALGTMAVAALRVDGLTALVAQERGSIELAKSRLGGGFGSPLDVDRLEIELSRTEQQLLANEGEMREALATCTSIVGAACAPFPSSDDARAFLSAWTVRAEEKSGPVEERPDVKVIDAYRRAAVAEGELARAQAIPDPTVRLGYTYDQFVVSGNQRHSLSLSVSLPIPLFDRGQAQLHAAEARQSRFALQRDRVLTTARVRIVALKQTLETRQRRRDIIVKDMLPRARIVVGDLEKAAQNRLIPLTDVIQARRTLSEILVQEAESYGDTFMASVEILAESPAASSPAEANDPEKASP